MPLPLIFIFVLTCLITGCASSPKITEKPSFDSHAVPSITLQSTKETQLLELFGKAEGIATRHLDNKSFKIHKYRFSTQTHKQRYAKHLFVEVLNDTVNAYSFRSNFTEDSTDFDEQRRHQITIGHSTKAMIEALLGKPSTRMHLPSTLLQGFFQDEGIDKAQGASEAWAYKFADWQYNAKGEKTKSLRKYLVVYFNSDNVVSNILFRKKSREHPQEQSQQQ